MQSRLQSSRNKAELGAARCSFSFQERDMLTFPTGATLRIDCGFRGLDLHSRSGNLLVPATSTLWLERCYVNNYASVLDADLGGPWLPGSLPVTSRPDVFVGQDITVRMDDCVVRWWNEVPPPLLMRRAVRVHGRDPAAHPSARGLLAPPHAGAALSPPA